MLRTRCVYRTLVHTNTVIIMLTVQFDSPVCAVRERARANRTTKHVVCHTATSIPYYKYIDLDCTSSASDVNEDIASRYCLAISSLSKYVSKQ